MPSSASITMRTGTHSLGCLLSPKPKSKHLNLPPPEFTHTLSFDSIRLLSGLFTSHRGIEYAIATCGTRTVISCPERSTDVATIEWKGGWVDMEGTRIQFSEWVGRAKWGSSTHVFKKWNNIPEIKWEMRDGNWEATDSRKQVLAIFAARRGSLASRIELTDAGITHTDALVLTGIITVAGKKEWKWHNYTQARKDSIQRSDGASGSSTYWVSDETLPSYREAPFTRPLSAFLDCPPPSIDQGVEFDSPKSLPPRLSITS